jgi:putative NADH-flavin reductase
MKITIIGATRGIGLALANYALEKGHEVTVLVRDAAKIDIQHRNLKIRIGDLLNQSSIEAALPEQDVICTCIGIPPSRKPVDTFSKGITTVLAAMKNVPGARLIAVTGIGAGDSRGHGGFVYDKLINPLLLAEMFKDKDREEAIIKASNVDWTIVRPGMLTNGPRTGKYRVFTKLDGITAKKISRADVADFIVQQMEQPGHSRQTPLITY